MGNSCFSRSRLRHKFPPSFVLGCTSGEFFNSSSKLPYSETEKCVEMIEPITNKAFTQTSACFGENGELSDSRMWHNTETTTSDIKESTKDADKSISVPESELENRRDVTNRGTRPKVKTNNMQKPSNTHLSNKKRKELAKQEKKQRREGRKKEEVNGVQESSVTVEQSVSGVVADLGVLAI